MADGTPDRCTRCEHCKPEAWANFHVLRCAVSGGTIVQVHFSDVPFHWSGQKLMGELYKRAEAELSKLVNGKPRFCPFL